AAYPADKTIHRLFEDQVAKNPNTVALTGPSLFRDGDGTINVNYSELDKESGYLAQHLHREGVTADSIVAVKLERSVEMMITLLGILKAGGAYLPIDPNYPLERINYMLKDSNAVFCISDVWEQEKNNDQLSMIDYQLLMKPSPPSAVKSESEPRTPHPGNLAYVIYTSGSTGEPKGTMMEHRSLTNIMFALNERYPVDAGDVYLLKTSYMFDVSLSELFGWFWNGGRLSLLKKGWEKDPVKILEAIESNRVTHINFVPSMFSAFVNILNKENIGKLSPLKYLFLAGEQLPENVMNRFNGFDIPLKVENLYGPTEAAIYTSAYPLSRWNGDRRIPIGSALPNVQLYILSKDGYLQPVGVPGELYIGGTGVARGYLNRPRLTAEKFVDNPHLPGEKHYRSGDLCRYTENGDLEYLGRIDFQVKIRGFRIEPGEIEAHLSRHDAVTEAVVSAKDDKDGNRFLCAYIVTGGEVDLGGLKEFLARHVPDYMVPSFIVPLEKIPLTSNGKLDRKALPDPEGLSLREDVGYMAPTTPLERVMVDIWEKVLGRENIGINENFFFIGGDSIKSIQIISRINSSGYKLEMNDLFQNPIISKLTQYVKKTERIPAQSAVSGPIPLTPIQKDFFEQSNARPHHFNLAVMLHSREELDKKILLQVFSHIREHHDALRMTYKAGNDENAAQVVQTNQGLDYPISLEEFDLKNSRDAAAALRDGTNRIQAGIDLENGPLMKVGLFRMDDGDRLLIAVHHLVIDGISWRILLEDIESLYSRYKKGEKPALPLKADSFKLWSETLAQYADGKSFLKEKGYWARLESENLSLPALPRDFEAGESLLKQSEKIEFSLGESETTLLLTEVNKAFNTEINDILLTALGLAVKKTFAQNHALIELEGHGREEILGDLDISRTVGWFTTKYPVMMNMSYADNPARQIKEIKETLRNIPNRGIGYGILRYLTAPENRQGIPFGLAPRVLFNYLGQFDADVNRMSVFEMAKEFSGVEISLDNRMVYDYSVGGMVVNNRLIMSFTYSSAHYKPETAAALAGHLESELKQLIAFCGSREKTAFTPADFTYKGLSISVIDELTRRYPDMEDLYTLTPMQEGMLFHALADESSYSYFEQVSYRLHGQLDIALMEKSLVELSKRHDILRTLFVHKDVPHPVQMVMKNRNIGFCYHDIDDTGDREEKENLAASFKVKDKERSFDFNDSVLMRISVLRVDESEYEFLWSSHHILMDGWCRGILNNEFFEIYTAFLENRPHKLPPVKPYRTYIQWLENRDKDESEGYWKQYLDSFEEQTGIPRTGLLEETGKGYNIQSVTAVLDNRKVVRLMKLASSHNVTLNSVTQTLWAIILAKYTGKEDVVFGSVVSSRPADLPGVESLVGLFINTVPVRIRLDEAKTFVELLRRVQKDAVECEPHHYYPLAEIQAQSIVKQNLINHLFIFENFPLAEQIEGLEDSTGNDSMFNLSRMEVFEQTNYDFNVTISVGNQLTVTFKYNANVYDPDMVDAIKNHFEGLISQIVVVEDMDLCRFTILSEAEKHRLLYEFNDTSAEFPMDKTIQRLFEEQVEKTPHRVALAGPLLEPGLENEFLVNLSYLDLNERAQRAAGKLIDKGVTTGTIVALLAGRSVETIIGLLGILKAGGSYLPVDSELPVERIDYMLSDSGVRLLAAHPALTIPGGEPGETVSLAQNRSCTNIPAARHAGPSSGPTDSAYVIYTSGSTGRPKGVMLEHRSVVNFIYGIRSIIDFNETDIVLSLTTISFDIFVLETLLPLSTGSRVIIGSKEEQLNPEAAARVLIDGRVTIFQLTPSRLSMLTANQESTAALKILECLLVGGEAFPEQLLEKTRAITNAKIYNMYGPTETTVWSTVKNLSGREPLNIGKPIINTDIYILDKNDNLQPIGVPGELYIGGEGLAKGYLNRPGLTAEKFRKIKFELDSTIYHTGDLARWLPNGEIQCLGRVDHQVKIRGFRIELGEIEHQLLNHDSIKEAVVTVREDAGGDQYLCAYFTVEHQAGETQAPDSRDLREFLSHSLPEYMFPSYFIPLSSIPLSPSGKIDRNALPQPHREAKGKHSAPVNVLEEKLALLWAEALGKEESIISMNSDFFDLGGHSLKATIMVSSIHRELDVKVPVAEIFKNRTIRALSEYIMQSGENKYLTIEPVETREYYDVSSGQKRVWLLSQSREASLAFNMAESYFLKEELNIDLFIKTFDLLIRRHESLRTVFLLENQEVKQKVLSPGELNFNVNVEHMEGIEGQDQKEKPAGYLLKMEHETPFDLANGPLVRVKLLKINQGEYVFSYAMHHIISDFVSMEVLYKEFSQLYQSLLKNEQSPLMPLRVQYKDFTRWQNNQLQGRYLKRLRDYWWNRFNDKIPVLRLPYDRERPAIQSYSGENIDFSVSEEVTGRLRAIANHNDATLFMILMASVNILLSFYSGQNDIIIGVPASGREHPDLENQIGFYLNTLPMRTKFSEQDTFMQLLHRVKKTVLDAHEHQMYHLDQLVDELKIKRQPGRLPLFDVMVDMLNLIQFQDPLKDSSAEPGVATGTDDDESIMIRRGKAKCDLTFYFIEEIKQLNISFEYSTDLFERPTMMRMVKRFRKLLKDIVNDPDLLISKLLIEEEIRLPSFGSFISDTMSRETPMGKI
ncbi:MAG: amino acid adenylation domain-containing protein, partial [bacterium]|nr:amino acid adenylation domain-containing protein [bacterium]